MWSRKSLFPRWFQNSRVENVGVKNLRRKNLHLVGGILRSIAPRDGRGPRVSQYQNVLVRKTWWDFFDCGIFVSTMMTWMEAKLKLALAIAGVRRLASDDANRKSTIRRGAYGLAIFMRSRTIRATRTVTTITKTYRLYRWTCPKCGNVFSQTEDVGSLRIQRHGSPYKRGGEL
jgi:hypothetical protein